MKVTLRPWTEDDLALSFLLNEPSLTDPTGGPETDEQVRRRHERYVAGPARMFVVLGDGEVVGSHGVWESAHSAEPALETGWKTLPAFQGRGVATAATQLVVTVARELGTHRWLHAYPGRDNAASNATCRSAGFHLVGPLEIEYPPGHQMLVNDWRLDLGPAGGRGAPRRVDSGAVDR